MTPVDDRPIFIEGEKTVAEKHVELMAEQNRTWTELERARTRLSMLLRGVNHERYAEALETQAEFIGEAAEQFKAARRRQEEAHRELREFEEKHDLGPKLLDAAEAVMPRVEKTPVNVLEAYTGVP